MDPYYEWLGIPAEEQPPNHYRLLGINVFESNPKVIESAVNQRMAYLQQLSGDQASVDDAQRIMGEISRARLTILHKEKKSAYDKSLRNKQSQQSVPPSPPPQQRVNPPNESRDLSVKRTVSQNASHFKSVVKIDKRFFILVPVFALLIFSGIMAVLFSGAEHSGSMVPNTPQSEQPTFSRPRDKSATSKVDSRPITVQPVPSVRTSPNESIQASVGQQGVVKQQETAVTEKTTETANIEANKGIEADRIKQTQKQKIKQEAPLSADHQRNIAAREKLEITVAIGKILRQRHPEVAAKIEVLQNENGGLIQFVIKVDGNENLNSLHLVGSFNNWASNSKFELKKIGSEWRTMRLNHADVFKGEASKAEFKFLGSSNTYFPDRWDHSFSGEHKNLILQQKPSGGISKTYILKMNSN